MSIRFCRSILIATAFFLTANSAQAACPSIPEFLRIKEIKVPYSTLPGDFEITIRVPDLGTLPDCVPMGNTHGFQLAADTPVELIVSDQLSSRVIQRNQAFKITFARTLGDGGWGTLGFADFEKQWIDFPITAYTVDFLAEPQYEVIVDRPSSTGASRTTVKVAAPTLWNR